MNKLRDYLLLACALAFSGFLISCGDAAEGGNSGSIIRVVGTDPLFLTPDLYLSICTPATDTEEAEFEDGLTNQIVDVTVINESRPNSDDPLTADVVETTNSYVTLNRYRVDFAVLDMSATIPTLDGGGLGTGVDTDGSPAVVTINVLDFESMEWIRTHYPDVGNGRSMRVRADITIWGRDAFGNSVKATPNPSVTMVIDNYDRCDE